ncbi:S1 family peptidase, partial [Streptomyces sp. URMC 123]|uniref:S1 family peptidase n=1 Tax=Streptomyces sp. URMC 123 TaxID=3423403 RepID=UPI003F1D50C2
ASAGSVGGSTAGSGAGSSRGSGSGSGDEGGGKTAAGGAGTGEAAAGGAGRAGGSGPGDGGNGGGDGGAGNGGGAGAPEGGDAIFGGGSRCSLGFNVSLRGAPAFLTAGHCGNASRTWSADQGGGRPLGTVEVTEFPVKDFALVRYDDATVDAPSSVDLQNGTRQAISRAAEANVGMRVTRSGSTTGSSSGTVTGLNATVNYGNGDIVNGLIQTDVCAEPGDSGGSLFSGDAAIGLTSGGSGDCTQGGETFFHPVTDALRSTGATIG